ncbi:MAG: glycogen/starch/alpha-glucan phosphorylase [Anaerolineae bacterium]|nr:glycogen/starch/alpha-glucan phosphorylase [Anaerolineae bacterium]
MSRPVTSSRRNGKTAEAFEKALADNLYYTRGQAIYTASPYDVYTTLAYTIRDYLMERWRKTVDTYFETNPKFVFYLSAEYLLGRQLTQNMLYTGTTELARQALKEYDFGLDELIEFDYEPGLGNGGLGRLAACFLDSLATLDIPCIGYGIRYEFGIFKQSFKDGWQVESPDEWLYYGTPWEFAQPDDMVEVGFGGYTQGYTDEQGNYRVRWLPGQTVLGEPFHTLVPGYKTNSVNLLRLWRARASKEFDFQLFDVGDYARAVHQKTFSENITKVLYPNDNTPQGKELRLKQQYFFVACSLQDIIRRYLVFNDSLEQLPEKAVIQLNDTHPVVAIPELMRILLDDYKFGWDQAWNVTTRMFAYTCHTLMPEALEKWPVDLFERLLPRHLEIIFEINSRFLNQVRTRFPNDEARVARMSIIEEGPEQQVRMAHLASVGCFSINGVAELQSKLLREKSMRDFADMWPEKFNNKTNGVTPRRFIRLANPRLADLITTTIGDGWLTDLEQLKQLEAHADSARFRRAWREVKQRNKEDLAAYILKHTGLKVDPNSLFDVMVKRLHEYKRQLLKALHIITLYNRIKANPDIEIIPRTFIFGAKAAPGYYMAKLIIKLINSLAEVVNNDPDVRNRLKVVFLPNFNVSLGEKIYPAADVSEQISMAGKEASGTGNMKFALNGALTTGTLDGANIEIRERVGEENFFLFGLTAEEAFNLKNQGYIPMDSYRLNPELKQAIDRIASGYFANGDQELFRPIVDSLLYHDEYLLLADYQSYIDCQDEVSRRYQYQESWTRMSILNTARCGFFSSDRSIRQYCQDIWQVQPVKTETE